LSFIINIGRHGNHIELFFVLRKAFGNFFPLSNAFSGFLKQCLLAFQAIVMMKESAKRIPRHIDLPMPVGSRRLDVFDFNGFAVVVLIQNDCCIKSDVVTRCSQWINSSSTL